MDWLQHLASLHSAIIGRGSHFAVYVPRAMRLKRFLLSRVWFTITLNDGLLDMYPAACTFAAASVTDIVLPFSNWWRASRRVESFDARLRPPAETPKRTISASSLVILSRSEVRRRMSAAQRFRRLDISILRSNVELPARPDRGVLLFAIHEFSRRRGYGISRGPVPRWWGGVPPTPAKIW